MGEAELAVEFELAADAHYRVGVSTSAFWDRPGLVPSDLELSHDEREAYFGGFARLTLHFWARYRADIDALRDLRLEHATN